MFQLTFQLSTFNLKEAMDSSVWVALLLTTISGLSTGLGKSDQRMEPDIPKEASW